MSIESLFCNSPTARSSRCFVCLCHATKKSKLKIIKTFKTNIYYIYIFIYIKVNKNGNFCLLALGTGYPNPLFRAWIPQSIIRIFWWGARVFWEHRVITSEACSPIILSASLKNLKVSRFVEGNIILDPYSELAIAIVSSYSCPRLFAHQKTLMVSSPEITLA